MKNTIIVLALFLCGACSAQQTISTTNDPDNAYFVGTWEYQNGNNIFRLHIWERQNPSDVYVGDYFVNGDYELVQVDASGQETLIYTSVPSNFPGWPGTFSGVVHPSGTLSGGFQEIHIGSSGLNGSFKIEIVSSCLSCPDKISWKVTEGKGIRFTAIGAPPRPDHFVVPNNIVLVKVP